MTSASYLHNPLTRILDRNKITGTDYQVVRFSLAIKFVEVTLRTTNHICHAFQLAVPAFFVTQSYLSSKSKGEKSDHVIVSSCRIKQKHDRQQTQNVGTHGTANVSV
jgi:hypothetical protein